MPLPPRKVVIVGASLAGSRTAQALRGRGFDGEIVVLGDERHLPYDRPPLSKKYATGQAGVQDLALVSDHADVTWRLGCAAVALDPQRRRVRLADGTSEGYDRLVIACGTRPVTPAGLDVGLRGVQQMRTLDDADRLRGSLANGVRRVVVLGAGFIGGELASTCRDLGVEVTLVDPALHPLARPLGHEVARHLLGLHRQAGTRFRLGTAATELTASGGVVTGVSCTDGAHLPADLVVIAAGVRPATDWLRGSGLATDDGVLCRSDLTTISHRDVLAVGDVARWTHPTFGESMRVEHWSNAVEGAQVAAATILGLPARHDAVPSFWTDQLGIKIQGIGLTADADAVDVEVDDGHPFATYHRRGRLVGAVSFGRARKLMPIRRELAAASAA